MTDSAPGRAPLPTKALDTTAQNPWPVRLLSSKIADYVAKMPTVWVEGQVAQLNAHNSSSTAWITLRDTDVDMSVSVTVPKRSLPPTVSDGAHVVVQGRPEYWVKRGSLQLAARSVRLVGIGDLLARIEQLRRLLAAEGIFDTDRKRALPFLPTRVGLICAPKAKAQDDVVANARDRWPQVAFEIREVPVQGPRCVEQVVTALAELDADPAVDVIIITRGGGSVEDLLPFSNETMVRAVADAHTPVVSAIGHESDSPLLDLVADYRASTPTDAAKRVVPDLVQERAMIASYRDRLGHALRRRVSAEQDRLDALRGRRVLADPAAALERHHDDLHQLQQRSRRAVEARLLAVDARVETLRTAVRTLSPQATLNRGYAVLQTMDGTVVRAAEQVEAGDEITARLARSRLGLLVQAVDNGTGSAVVGSDT
ncbi:MAG: exodeoxyribonuclease VII large subunit [Beutenbergiaceae bacterium]